jgi:hypothetical protein
VLFSPRVDEWASLGVLFVTEPNDLESIRRTIGEAVRYLEEDQQQGRSP